MSGGGFDAFRSRWRRFLVGLASQWRMLLVIWVVIAGAVLLLAGGRSDGRAPVVETVGLCACVASVLVLGIRGSVNPKGR